MAAENNETSKIIDPDHDIHSEWTMFFVGRIEHFWYRSKLWIEFKKGYCRYSGNPAREIFQKDGWFNLLGSSSLNEELIFHLKNEQFYFTAYLSFKDDNFWVENYLLTLDNLKQDNSQLSSNFYQFNGSITRYSQPYSDKYIFGIDPLAISVCQPISEISGPNIHFLKNCTRPNDLPVDSLHINSGDEIYLDNLYNSYPYEYYPEVKFNFIFFVEDKYINGNWRVKLVNIPKINGNVGDKRQFLNESTWELKELALKADKQRIQIKVKNEWYIIEEDEHNFSAELQKLINKNEVITDNTVSITRQKYIFNYFWWNDRNNQRKLCLSSQPYDDTSIFRLEEQKLNLIFGTEQVEFVPTSIVLGGNIFLILNDNNGYFSELTLLLRINELRINETITAATSVHTQKHYSFSLIIDPKEPNKLRLTSFPILSEARKNSLFTKINFKGTITLKSQSKTDYRVTLLPTDIIYFMGSEQDNVNNEFVISCNDDNYIFAHNAKQLLNLLSSGKEVNLLFSYFYSVDFVPINISLSNGKKMSTKLIYKNRFLKLTILSFFSESEEPEQPPGNAPHDNNSLKSELKANGLDLLFFLIPGILFFTFTLISIYAIIKRRRK